MQAPDGVPMLLVPEWIERHCVVPDRHRAGAPFVLYGWQLRFFAAFYLVKSTARWDPLEPILGPAFVYRRALTVGPQKMGKGPKMAAHICAEGVGPALFAGWAGRDDGYACADHGCRCGWEYPYEPGEPMGRPWATPLIQITAYSQEQADNIYDVLRPMIELGPLSDLIPRTGEDEIRLPGGGSIGTVTSSAQSRLGQRITFAPQDELQLWTAQNKMTRVADAQYRGLAGMGGRASLDTNAWDPAENSVAQQQYESAAKDIYRQMSQAPANLSFRNKVERRRILRHVYEDSTKERGGHVDLDSIDAEAADLLERDPAQAERFFGNRILAGLGAWQPDGLWQRSENLEVGVRPGSAVALGFDGSENDDHTGIRLCTLDGHRFTPRYGPDRRPTHWDPRQWGGSIPRGEVHAAVDELCRRYRVVLAYCDPRDWQSEIGDWALKHGEKVFVEWATYRTTHMHDALERALTDVITGRSTHDDCPVTAQHVGNARKIAKPGDRYILGKPDNHRKIDMAMADVLANEAAAVARGDEQAAAESYAYVM